MTFGGSQLEGGWVAPGLFPVGLLLARWCEGQEFGAGVGLPLLEPIFLLDPASSFLRPEGPPGSQEGRPQSYTSRRVRHCLGSLFWYRWQQVLLGLLWVSLLRLGSRVGWGWASGASSDPTHSEMLRDRSMWGRRCQFGDAALRRCPKGQKDGRMQEMEDLRTCLWEPLSHHPP